MKLATRPTRRRRLPSLCVAGLLTGGALSSLSAQTTAYTWNGGSGDWGNGSLWNTGTAPNASNAAVYIDGGKTGVASVVNVNASYTVGQLTLDAGDTLNLNAGGLLDFVNGTSSNSSSQIVNNGTINLVGSNNNGYGALVLDSPVTLTGNGTINLTGPYAIIAGNAVSLTIGAGQTVAGEGNLGSGIETRSLVVTNAGTVTANRNGGTLVLAPGNGISFTNTGAGSARAENGGKLELSNDGRFIGGSFTALTGSTVQVDGYVSGATLASSGSGVVNLNQCALDNVTVAAGSKVNVTSGITIGFTGTLTNNSTLNLVASQLSLSDATATLSGQGTTILGPSASITNSFLGGRLTVDTGQIITGQGNMGQGGMTFTNNGNVTANVAGATLTLQPGGTASTGADFTNNGTLSATNGGTLAFRNANAAAQYFSNAPAGTLTNNGTLSVGSGSTITVPAGALTNFSGTTLTGGTYNVTGSGANSPATLALGGGSIVTNNASVNLSGAGSVFTEINALANNQGTFSVNNGRSFTTAGALTNSGLLTSSGGSNLTFTGNLTNSGLVGTAFTTTAATISVQGTLASSGTIVVSTYDTVSATAAINVTSAGQIVASGTLTAPTFALAGALRPGDGINFATRNVTPFAGSFTLNGQVNLSSTTTLVFDLGTTTTSDQLQVNGALTLDGTLTVNALAGFGAGRYDLINYTGTLTNNTLDLGTVPSGYTYRIDTSRAGEVDLIVTSVVPEPSTWAALLTGGGFLALALRRCARAH